MASDKTREIALGDKVRTVCKSIELPIITQDRGFLLSIIK